MSDIPDVIIPITELTDDEYAALKRVAIAERYKTSDYILRRRLISGQVFTYTNNGATILTPGAGAELSVSTIPKAVLDSLPEPEAFALLGRLEQRFGWSVAVATRHDVETLIAQRPLDDAEWETLRHHNLWTDMLPKAALDRAIVALNENITTVLPALTKK